MNAGSGPFLSESCRVKLERGAFERLVRAIIPLQSGVSDMAEITLRVSRTRCLRFRSSAYVSVSVEGCSLKSISLRSRNTTGRLHSAYPCCQTQTF